jgi:hypothetical protein
MAPEVKNNPFPLTARMKSHKKLLLHKVDQDLINDLDD